MVGTTRWGEQSLLCLLKQIADVFSLCKASKLYSLVVITFRTICTKSLEFCGESPWSWQVQASREDACATIRMLFPETEWETQAEEGEEASFLEPRAQDQADHLKCLKVDQFITSHQLNYVQ